jgi:DNA-binding CsgD family transcriptional regulator
MSQSTMVDSAGDSRRPGARSPRAIHPNVNYEQAFAVLEQCDSAACLSDFKSQVVESLGSVFGFRNVSFFAGPTFGTTFSDASPVVNGSTARMLGEYHDRWSQHDIFGIPASLRMLQSGGVASLPELVAHGAIPATAEAYVRHFVAGTWQMETAAAMRIDLYGLHTGLVGIFCGDGEDLGSRELATLRLLSRQLSAVARGIPFVSARADFEGLTERQREVVHLISEGLSNAQIAATLSLAEDSIKKYVSRILSSTGCGTRMELALLARSGRRTQD